MIFIYDINGIISITSNIIIFLVCAAVAVPLENVEKEYQRFVEIPGGDGQMHLVDLEEQPDYELLQEIERNPANNQYLLYTRYNF